MFTGKIVKLSAPIERGQYNIQEFLVSEEGRESNIIPFTTFKPETMNKMKVGDVVEIEYYLKGNKGKDGKRYFTNVMVRNINLLLSSTPPQSRQYPETQAYLPPKAQDMDDDLPF